MLVFPLQDILASFTDWLERENSEMNSFHRLFPNNHPAKLGIVCSTCFHIVKIRHHLNIAFIQTIHSGRLVLSVELQQLGLAFLAVRLAPHGNRGEEAFLAVLDLLQSLLHWLDADFAGLGGFRE